MTTSAFDIPGNYYQQHTIERIAIGYKASLDQLGEVSDDEIHLFRKLIQLQFADISKNIYFDFVEDHPYRYTYIDEMLLDFRKGFIKINTSGNDSRLWGKVYNLQFRAIHDYIHCLHHLDFNFPDEVKAFNKQIAFSVGARYALKFPHLNWDKYTQALKSEIIYQAAVKAYFKVFDLDTQKIVLTEL
jgi:hypothetical protein